MYVCMDVSMAWMFMEDPWMHGCMDGWMDGWMDACMMHGCMDAWIHALFYLLYIICFMRHTADSGPSFEAYGMVHSRIFATGCGPNKTAPSAPCPANASMSCSDLFLGKSVTATCTWRSSLHEN